VLGAALRAADRDLEDLTLLDAKPWRVLVRVTLPQAAWGAAAAALLVFLLVATDFTITDILVIRTFAEEVYSQYILHRRQAGPLLTAVPTLLALAALLACAPARLGLLGEHSLWQHGTRPRVYALGRWRPPAGVACGLLLAIALGGPLALLFGHVRPLEGLGRSIAGMQRELWVSAALSALGATLTLLPAPGLAWSLVRGGRWCGWSAAGLVLLLATPAPVVGISLITLLNRPGVCGWIYDSPLVIVLGYFVRFLPVAALLLVPAVQRLPREVELAARLDGCDWLAEHWHIRCPSLRRDAALVWLVVVILCFAEIGATKLLDVPGWETASVRAFTLIHFGVYRDLAVLALLSTAFILLPWAGLLWLLHRARPIFQRPWEQLP